MDSGKLFKRPKPFVLIIADGLGVAPPGPGNAIMLANTPNIDSYWFKYPHTYLHASGSAVGLPSGTNGNSEVGHTNIGAGKVVFQELPRIDNSIENKTFFENETLKAAAIHVKQTGGKLHLIGLLSRGNVHSSLPHAFACVQFCRKQELTSQQLVIHAFTDGRDTPPKSAFTYLEEIEGECQRQSIGRIGSMIGRFYAMDRDERWDRTKLAYDLLTKGIGKKFSTWKDALEDAYNNKETDEYISPRVLVDDQNQPIGIIKPGDAVVFFNYRPDRAIQLTRAFEQDRFKGWDRGEKISNLVFAGLNEYEEGIPKLAAFPPEDIALPLGRIISEAGMRQLRIAESEKFPHVTYFLNGGNDIPYNAEDRMEVPSPRDVTTYDKRPEMSAYKVKNIVNQKIREGLYDFIAVNLANPDMVAHTGVIEAAVRAIEITDECIGEIV